MKGKTVLFLSCLFLLLFYSSHAQVKQGEFVYDNTDYEGTGTVIQTKGGGYVLTGTSYTSVYVIKTDNNASLLWAKKIGGSSDNGGYSMTLSKDGSYVITGFTGSYGAGNDDVYVMKLDTNGNLKWTKTIGGPNYDYGYSVIHCSDGGYAIAGSTGVGSYDVYAIKLDSNGNLLWTKTIGGTGDDQGYSIIQCEDKGLAIAGRTQSYGAGGYDVYVIKLDSVGNLKWTKTIGGTGDDEGYGIIQGKDGGYVVAGYTDSYGAGARDMYVIKLDSAGNLIWTKTIGGSKDDEGYYLIQNNRGDYVISGATNSFGPGVGANVYLVCLDTGGNLKWTKAIGGQYDDFGGGIIQTSDSGYAIAASSNSFAAGGHYVYLIKTDSLGNTCADTGSGGNISSGGVEGSGGTAGSSGTVSSGGTDSIAPTTTTNICSVMGIPSLAHKKNIPVLYPNPCTTMLYIQPNDIVKTQHQSFSVSVFDIYGRTLLKVPEQKQTSTPCPIDVSSLAPGMYFVRIQYNSGVVVKKFIKQ